MKKERNLISIVGASSVGTLIEWYDFYVFGSLVPILSTKFFPSSNPALALISTLATFAVGFVVRPFGALFFGRLGDIVGRKQTFMITLLLMGGATFVIGLVPSYETIGILAPLLVLLLRILQGLALGGEYGGAATYVAEHAPTHRRGFWTSWIQTTATIGLLVSLIVISITRNAMSKESFDAWGWRIPFICSVFVVLVSYIIRRGMEESPLFKKAKEDGKLSTNPLKESFGNKLNLKYVLLGLLGGTTGQGLIWYTSQFYAMSFMKTNMKILDSQAESILIWGIVFATPFFVFFGWLSDRIGRKWIIMSGMLLAVVTYRPIFSAMYNIGDLKLKTEIVEKRQHTVTNTAVIKDGISTGDSSIVTTTQKEFEDGTSYTSTNTQIILADKTKQPIAGKTKETITVNNQGYWKLILFAFILVFYVTLSYAPLAALLVELFPVQIRYTSMSLPVNIGAGVFGGLVPAIATALVFNAEKINMEAIKIGKVAVYSQPYLEGLWYPLIMVSISFVIGVIYLDNKKRHN